MQWYFEISDDFCIIFDCRYSFNAQIKEFIRKRKIFFNLVNALWSSQESMQSNKRQKNMTKTNKQTKKKKKETIIKKKKQWKALLNKRHNKKIKREKEQWKMKSIRKAKQWQKVSRNYTITHSVISVVFGVFLVFIFPYTDWIRRDTKYLKIKKYGTEKLRIRTFFTQGHF